MQVFQATQPDIIEEISISKDISKIDFISLFRDSEYAAIIAAVKTDPLVELWYEKLKLLDRIDLSHEFIVNSMQLLVNKTLITSERSTQILNNQKPINVEQRDDGIYNWNDVTQQWVKISTSNTGE